MQMTNFFQEKIRLGISWFNSSRHAKLIVGASLLATTVWIWALWPKVPVLEMTFLSVGQGDSIVVRSPSGRTLVVDCGPGPTEKSNYDAGAKVVTPYLKRQGVSLIDALIITHPHDDHIGGAPAILNNFRVARFLEPAIMPPVDVHQEVLDILEKKGIPHQPIHRGDRIDLHDGVIIEVLNPPSTLPAPESSVQENDSSAVLRIRFGNVAFLLTGDAGELAEADMIESCANLSARVLKVGHHGSASATSNNWLEAVNPKVAVVCVGYKNQFGHPKKETLERLESAGAQVYRTDLDGAVIVTTDGNRLHVATRKTRWH